MGGGGNFDIIWWGGGGGGIVQDWTITKVSDYSLQRCFVLQMLK